MLQLLARSWLQPGLCRVPWLQGSSQALPAEAALLPLPLAC